MSRLPRLAKASAAMMDLKYEVVQHQAMCTDLDMRAALAFKQVLCSEPSDINIVYIRESVARLASSDWWWVVLHEALPSILKRWMMPVSDNVSLLTNAPLSESFWKVSSAPSAFPLYRHPTGWYWGFHVDKVSVHIILVREQMYNLLMGCKLPFVAARVHMPGHISLALADMKHQTIELFDSSGKTEGTVLAMLALQTLMPKFSVQIVSDENLQSSKEDVYCQTSIWMFVWYRLFENFTASQFVQLMTNLHPVCRIELLKRFRTLLQELLNDGKPSPFTLLLLHQAQSLHSPSLCLNPTPIKPNKTIKHTPSKK